ncbi:MAG TPA: bifunctional tRNA (5-methylaminomethyl-2-thiouridine)(34)-methyltransferase MnmD/FAD-dependent 5-carboxymethylaminomethyl-2-thiouridine(34) oxidoreductase MnmC [Methylovorus sp.]|nr:bifunctional tRNA (5-methylaminomethyl-2-thiouridine)(34)-methyltransferase MnmD/FAD-dependent 5-carboxymethylaminomethyl-2-thiouridine(34) oxidoreductase MnmC [Methylovorus sp.]
MIEWRDGEPYSTVYQDVYFSRESGPDETRHVFLQHNQLRQRWLALHEQPTQENADMAARDHASHFTIAETGFGTGLNLLCAWQLWEETAPAHARLHFISTEKHPLTRDDMQQAWASWPEFSRHSAELLEHYQWLAPGMHRLMLANGRVILTLLVGDVADTLPGLRASVDAWFLDGFAPSRNPEMWQPPLFTQMARLSHADTTFATFTSAGLVKRGLQQAGFAVCKVPGHGRKREMLTGQFAEVSQLAADKPADASPEPLANADKPSAETVSAMPQVHTARARPARPTPGRAIVIGGGIAGCATSHALAERGWHVTLVERHPQIAAAASGNPLGVLYPRLAGQDIILSRLAQHGFLHSLRLLQQLSLSPADHARCGLLQLAYDARERERCLAIAARDLPQDLVQWLSSVEASALAGQALAQDALYFPAGGWVHPPAFCRALLNHPHIHLCVSTEALSIQHRDGAWQVTGADGWQEDAPVLVLAAATDTANFGPTAHLPLQAVRGQITLLPASANATPLNTIVCSDGYISPAVDGRHCLGATFDADDSDTSVKAQDHASNLAMLARTLPAMHAALPPLDLNTLEGRTAFRAATPDYLPMAGPVLDAAALQAHPPRHTANPADLPWLPGLYVNTGHGSKGLINAPLCAEMLASAIAGEPAPVDSKLLAALDPNRFLLRSMGLKRLVLGLAAYPS